MSRRDGKISDRDMKSVCITSVCVANGSSSWIISSKFCPLTVEQCVDSSSTKHAVDVAFNFKQSFGHQVGAVPASCTVSDNILAT